jgi:peptidoglycan/xylan/chitin deacetylase (PgdA/CDA1 family)
VSNCPRLKDEKEQAISAELFSKHMSMLGKSGKDIVGLSEGIDMLKADKLVVDSVAVTFDDGFRDTYNNAPDILERFKIPATFFVVYKYTEEGPGGKFMDWNDVFCLKRRGFEIGSHSYSHKRLNAATVEDLKLQIVQTRAFFQDNAVAVRYFAYPYGYYGDFPDTAQALAEKAGYEACFTNVMGANYSSADIFKMRRLRMSWRDNSLRFRMRLAGAYDWVDKFKRPFLKRQAGGSFS